MNVFEAVKPVVTARQVAEVYGIKVNRYGMGCCPFHSDRSPSMKFDNRFHCFGCQADGDAIDFVARLFDIPVKDAAMKIADDFGITYDASQYRSIMPRSREPTKEELILKQKKYTVDVLTEYLSVLNKKARDYAPRTFDEDWHPLFVEAMHKRDYIEYLLEVIDQTTYENSEALLSELQEEVKNFESRIIECRADREG